MNYNYQEDQEDESDLWLAERLLKKSGIVTFKGAPAEVVGYANGKILLKQNGKNIATDPLNVNLPSLEDNKEKL